MIYTQFSVNLSWICVCFLHGEMEIRFGLLRWSGHGQVSLWLRLFVKTEQFCFAVQIGGAV